MKIAVLGHRGLIGSSLCPFLEHSGHELLRLSARSIKDPSWRAAIQSCDAVINLAGEPIRGWWSESKKQEIRRSRVVVSRAIAEALSGKGCRVSVWINASATGFYGDRGDDVLTEDMGWGQGFLAGVCRDWEASALNAARPGLRVVCLRFGVVLSPRGGLVASLNPVFRLGLGAIPGNGHAWISWITLEDAVRVIEHVLNAEVSGPVNAVAPYPLRQEAFYHKWAQSLYRPLWLKIPSWMVRGVLGEQAELLLHSQRVVPRKLLDSGFCFKTPALEQVEWE